MKRDAFQAQGLRIETARDWDGRWFVCWKPHVSVYCRSRKEVLKFASWPIKTPTGDALRGWLDGIKEMDQKRTPNLEKTRSSVEDSGLSQELLATGFGPECHDVDNENTRMVT